MGNKLFVGAEALLLDSFRLAKQVYDSEYIPDVLIGIWRGGTPVGLCVHEYFMNKGHFPYHTAIKTESYQENGVAGSVDVSGLEHVLKILNKKKGPTRILLVDDVYDRGRTMKKVSTMIKEGTSLEHDIRFATIFYKPENNETETVPDYFLHETDRWIVFPHELQDLTEKEIIRKNPNVYLILKDD